MQTQVTLTPAGLLGAPLPAGYSPAEFATLEPVTPTSMFDCGPAVLAAWTRIEHRAELEARSRAVTFEAMIEAASLDGAD